MELKDRHGAIEAQMAGRFTIVDRQHHTVVPARIAHLRSR
nr:hypothetical protein [Paraburkholderia ribeironis]